ncbi:MAG: ATP-binding protein [Bacteroidales bacterium]|nr:ATP-binding protein [Bacteroidales bacterium]
MLKRKIYGKLLEWKATKKQECLLVNGARQIGKTFIIDAFGRENYSHYVYINLFKNPELKEIFEGSLEPNEIYKRLQINVKDVVLKEKETLIFIDEIQVCPKARTALKFLAIDDKYDVIASGSLLGIHYNQTKNEEEIEKQISIPVGYEREIEMYSLDFEEFLWANGISEQQIAMLREYFDKQEPIPAETNKKYEQLLREYLVVGGMPEVVNTFVETTNFNTVFETQKKILQAYLDDIQHYAKNTDKPKIKLCYESIPKQLAKEYTKFQYKTIEKKGSAKKYENAIAWLEDAGLVKTVRNVSLPEMPLKAYEQYENFKVYVTDIGMATSLFGEETQIALLKNELKGYAKGGIYENLIFDILHKRNIPLNYYKRGDNTQEIEFIFEKNSSVIPIEVKSKRGETTSLNEFIMRFNPPVGYKLVEGNIGIQSSKLTLPHYMVLFI